MTTTPQKALDNFRNWQNGQEPLTHETEGTIIDCLTSPQWRPISECPDDVKPVLLAWENSMKGYVANNAHIPDWCFTARPYCIHGTHGAKSWHREATHWQPLPEPPKEV